MPAVQSEKILCGRKFQSILYHSSFTARERQLKGNKTRTATKIKRKTRQALLHQTVQEGKREANFGRREKETQTKEVLSRVYRFISLPGKESEVKEAPGEGEDAKQLRKGRGRDGSVSLTFGTGKMLHR